MPKLEEPLLPIATRQELREWLAAHHEKKKACWVPVSIKPQPDTILYLDAVEEALCFGWVDGVKKKIDEKTLAQRLSPRQKRSNWTELNKERVRRMERLGLMTDAGRRILPDMGSFKIHPTIQEALEQDPIVYENFQAFPELYRRIRLDTIQSQLKADPEVFAKRLEKFLAHARNNKMYGDWHDDGRLL